MNLTFNQNEFCQNVSQIINNPSKENKRDTEDFNPKKKKFNNPADTPDELNMQPPNSATRQADNCLNLPSPAQGSLLQTLNLIHKLLALVDDDPAIHATPSVPDRQYTSVKKNELTPNLKAEYYQQINWLQSFICSKESTPLISNQARENVALEQSQSH